MASRVNLVIATPCYGGQLTWLYHESVMKLFAACMANGIDVTPLMIAGDALISRARNELLAGFLDIPSATHLLFIDADIGFEPEQARRLLAFDADVTAAAYPLKGIEWDRAQRLAAKGALRPEVLFKYVYGVADPARIEGRNGFIKAIYAGTGFMMIRCGALEKMCAAFPQLHYRTIHSQSDSHKDSPHRYALFDCMIEPETGAYLSEDFTFCRRWTSLGGDIWVDTQSKLTHIGPVPFAGDFSAMLKELPPE